MSRLIDADAMISAVENHYNNLTNDNVPQSIPDFYCEIEKLIDEQPTAYDVQKVVEQLEEESYSPPIDDMDPFYNNPTKVVGLKTAVKLVRTGGVE